ncbi:hypothetical protein [Vibrio phage LV6]|nr:hypothetical protein [Vibrio phage LV6]
MHKLIRPDVLAEKVQDLGKGMSKATPSERAEIINNICEAIPVGQPLYTFDRARMKAKTVYYLGRFSIPQPEGKDRRLVMVSENEDGSHPYGVPYFVRDLLNSKEYLESAYFIRKLDALEASAALVRSIVTTINVLIAREKHNVNLAEVMYKRHHGEVITGYCYRYYPTLGATRVTNPVEYLTSKCLLSNDPLVLKVDAHNNIKQSVDIYTLLPVNELPDGIQLHKRVEVTPDQYRTI